ncbi:MAG: methionyl-tRNA formyltransferase [Bacillota bacterium]
MEVTGKIIPPKERMPLASLDDPVLRDTAKPVKSFDDDLVSLLDKMANTMHHEGGIGLAAPQIGVSRRIVVAEFRDELVELINPEIVLEEGSQVGYEGCLSVPGYMGEVERPEKIRLRYVDRTGDKHWLDADGWDARVLSHELGHLEGQLFIDCSSRVLRLKPELGLRIVFMGTPEFADVILDSLLEDGYKVVGAVTAPDRRRGRGQKVTPSPVKERALDFEIPVLQPESAAEDPEFSRYLSWLEPDLTITAAYGRILSPEILKVPRLGSVNVHASLLPKYRGAAPIQRQILNGESEIGVTIYWMDEGMDSGPIIHQEPIEVTEDITAGELHDRLAEAGATALKEALGKIVAGEGEGEPQDHSRATFAPKISRGENVIDWSLSARAIERVVRAFNPKPGAETTWRGNRLKILKATTEHGRARPGEIVAVSEEGIIVGTGDGLCRITAVQPSSKKAMDVGDFVRGYDVQPGEILGGSE